MRNLAIALCIAALLAAPCWATSVFQSGGDRLAATQNTDGGWDWPLDDGNPATGSASNTVGPIAMGLAKAYRQTGDAGQLAALQAAAAFLQSKQIFSPSDGYIAAELDAILGGTANTDYVRANFYDKLAAGTYVRSGTTYDTAGYVNLIRTARAAQGIENLAAWDLGIGVVGAAAVGADTSAWLAGVKAEIDELAAGEYFDVLGLAGAVLGLATVGEDYDPQSGMHATASSLADLATALASYQIGDTGGFSWISALVAPGEETTQETAYALLALDAFDRAAYLSEIQQAGNWLIGTQLPTGGWENYVGDGENNEITGEALWGIAAAVPEPLTALLVGAAVASLAGYTRKRLVG